MRLQLAVIACGLCSIGVTAAAHATDSGKVLLCHGTASDTNPYVLIAVDASALAGHLDGTAPGHGPNNHPDYVLPSGSTTCTGGESPGE